MKLIMSVQGAAALHAAGDDVCPSSGIYQRDLVQYLVGAYHFVGRPNFLPNAPDTPLPVLTFQQGRLKTNTEEHLIHMLHIFANGELVAAQNTDAADAVLNDYTERLDRDLKYRYRDAAARIRRTYFSALVVQFEEALEDRIPAFRRISEIVSRAIPRPDEPFQPKILAFGHGDPTGQTFEPSLDMNEKADFVLQRRAGEPYSANRYFSTAPLKTAEHFKMLQEVEDACR